MNSKVILCDIEGTTTSISFVKDNLFPYAAKNVASFLDAQWESPDTQEAVKMLRDQSAADKQDNVDGCVAIAAATEDKAKQIESIVASVQWQMEHDRKCGPLKNLQGLMWVQAYKAGEFKGQVYADVAPALEAWTKAGRKVYIYSSGSAAIQRVHFEYSEAGDLAKYLSGYFDTKVGAKQEQASYEAIWKEVVSKEGEEVSALAIKDVLFLTDIPAEAKAAKAAGMEAVLLKRPGNAELTEEESKTYKVVESFAEIVFAAVEEEAVAVAPKRKIEEEEGEAGQDKVIPPAKVAKIETTKDEEMKTEAVAATDPVAVPSESKTDDVGETLTTKEKVTEEVKDVPMEEEESVATVTKGELPTASDAKTDEATTAGNVEVVEKKKDEVEKEEEEQKMEVDSTTAATAEQQEDKKDEKVTDMEKKVEQGEAKDKPLPDTDTDKAAAVVSSVVEEEKEPKTKTSNGEGGDVKDEEKKKVVEAAESEPSTAVDKVGDVAPEQLKPAAVENGSEEKEVVTTTKDLTEETKAAAIETKNGDADEKEATATTTTEKPETNGAEVAAAVVNGNGSEAAATNGQQQDHDSDKENDKSMEAKPEEVSTSELVVAPSAEEAAAAAKKCAAIDPAASAQTPVPAES